MGRIRLFIFSPPPIIFTEIELEQTGGRPFNGRNPRTVGMAAFSPKNSSRTETQTIKQYIKRDADKHLFFNVESVY